MLPRFPTHLSTWIVAATVALAVIFVSTTDARAQGSSAEILDAVVRLDAVIPRDAATAQGLGTRRSGHGIVIDDQGLILTIGYLILEADPEQHKAIIARAKENGLLLQDQKDYGLLFQKMTK